MSPYVKSPINNRVKVEDVDELDLMVDAILSDKKQVNLVRPFLNLYRQKQKSPNQHFKNFSQPLKLFLTTELMLHLFLKGR